MTTPIKQRFAAKWKLDPETGCWVWTDALNVYGYGRLSRGRALGPIMAHRFSYELHRGPIPEGLVIDHLCKNRACVNPDHLEIVTQAVNFVRGDAIERSSKARKARTHCRRGHPLSGDNLYVSQRGRDCRTCRAEAAQRYELKRPPRRVA